MALYDTINLLKGEMFMANLICAKCNQPIPEGNAVECPFCWEIYHKECWEDTENCLTCKKYNPIYELVQAQKEYETQNSQSEENENEYDKIDTDEEMPIEFNGKEMPSSPVANQVLFISNIVFILGVVSGLACVGYVLAIMWMTFAEIGMINAIISIVKGAFTGAVVIAIGWVASALIKGFAELINNSQKNAYYLSKLVEKQQEKDE